MLYAIPDVPLNPAAGLGPESSPEETEKYDPDGFTVSKVSKFSSCEYALPRRKPLEHDGQRERCARCFMKKEGKLKMVNEDE